MGYLAVTQNVQGDSHKCIIGAVIMFGSCSGMAGSICILSLAQRLFGSSQA